MWNPDGGLRVWSNYLLLISFFCIMGSMMTQAQEAQKIEVRNQAGFVMNFKGTNGEKDSSATGNYPIGQQETIDLATFGFPEGKGAWPIVKAILGSTKAAPEHFIYKKNCKTAVYEVEGATLTYTIRFEGVREDPNCGLGAIAQIIEVQNNAGFVLAFQGSFGGEDSDSTGNYPISQSRTIDLGSTDFPEGVDAWPVISAKLGKVKIAKEHFKYEKNCKTALYSVTGPIWSYDVKFEGVKDTSCKIPPKVQKIKLVNKAEFVMSFQVSYGEETSSPTTSYPKYDSETIDLAASSFYTGIEVWPEVFAVLGKQATSNDRVIFDLNCKTAVYKVSGTTLDYTVDFDFVEETPCDPLPNFPSTIPINRVPFLNWARNVDVPNIWSAAPRTQADVAIICNWAKTNGYLVRPRGIMHNWSPLTVPDRLPPSDKVLLVDTTKYLNAKTMVTGQYLVTVETGTTMADLLEFLENEEGGKGSATGYSFPHTPAPGHITVGGVLAIDAHGSAYPNPHDNFPSSYGSMSNHIRELKAVVTDSSGKYHIQTFKRQTDKDTKVLLAHLGRALLVEVTLEVIDNYNLRCQSLMDIPAATLFAKPIGGKNGPKSFGEFFEQSGRVEAIWFPFSGNPWMKVWTVTPEKPTESRRVLTPFNYIFAENLSPTLESLFQKLINGISSVTPLFGKTMETISRNGLEGHSYPGGPTYPHSGDIWGPSKNTLLYVKDSTLREMANGYAILLKKKDVQQAVFDVFDQHNRMLKKYDSERQWPINGPLEIRVTGLDDFDRPIISPLSVDREVIKQGWEVAMWFDVLTLPTQSTNKFYVEFEDWLLRKFKDTGRVMPEWSKGWGYTISEGPWANATFLNYVKTTLTTDRDIEDTWAHETAVLAKYDAGNLYTSPLLGDLFSPISISPKPHDET